MKDDDLANCVNGGLGYAASYWMLAMYTCMLLNSLFIAHAHRVLPTWAEVGLHIFALSVAILTGTCQTLPVRAFHPIRNRTAVPFLVLEVNEKWLRLIS